MSETTPLTSGRTGGLPEHAWLVALDIDGTVLHEDGTLSKEVIREVRRVRDDGHEVTLATGRSVSMTLPVLEQLELSPEFVVSSNGAITLRRDDRAPRNYRREHVEHFDPTPVLQSIRERLPNANYAVENESGMYRYTGWFPEGALDIETEQVAFDDLLTTVATRVVVIAPGHDADDFQQAVDDLGLHHVSYAVGWTNWLDIAPAGVNKSTALERVRERLAIPRHRVIAIGDGRNDIEMFQWAGAEGRAIAMGQAPSDVLAHATEVTRPDVEDGVAWALRSL